jgi:pyruvate kinase
MAELWYTLGPRTLGREAEVIDAGATGVRLTFSYSTAEYQQERAREHRRLAARSKTPFLIIADLAGEKFRLGRFAGSPSVEAAAGRPFRMLIGEVSEPAADGVLTVTNPAFFSQVREGDLVIVGDGASALQVDRVSEGTADVTVLAGGKLDQLRGLTVQGAGFRPSCLTEKDLDDLAFIAQSEAFDAVALSFVSSAQDVEQARSVLGAERVKLIAKIETTAGLSRLDEICRAADIVMAARGDLALALPWVELPEAVASIESAAKSNATPWIVATQIVEGLERFIMPTRAEICDLGNWMGRGCAGALISYETAFGSHPIEAVRCARMVIDRWSKITDATR